MPCIDDLAETIFMLPFGGVIIARDQLLDTGECHSPIRYNVTQSDL